MDHMAPKERDFDIDLENGQQASEDTNKDSSYGVKTQAKDLLAMICSTFADGSLKGDSGVNPANSNDLPTMQVKLEGEKTINRTVVEKKVVKEKHKKMSNKKSPKPPRPPRGPSLDAADQKLIKEIAELAMLKRARVERMKALKKMKAAKGSSSSSSMNIIALVSTILFCLVIIFQAMSSRVTSVNIQGSPGPAETAGNGLIPVEHFGNPSASHPSAPLSSSANVLKLMAGFDRPENPRRAVR